MINQNKNVMIDYTNHAGKRELRTVRPLSIWYGTTKWHPEPQWLMSAVAQDRDNDVRHFAMRNIHEWR